MLIDLDVGNLFTGFEQQNLLIGQLQASLIRNHMPAAERFVVAAIPVKGDTNVHIAGIELFGRLGQGGLDGAQHHVTLYVFLT